jgi:hypothetical protein
MLGGREVTLNLLGDRWPWEWMYVCKSEDITSCCFPPLLSASYSRHLIKSKRTKVQLTRASSSSSIEPLSTLSEKLPKDVLYLDFVLQWMTTMSFSACRLPLRRSLICITTPRDTSNLPHPQAPWVHRYEQNRSSLPYPIS